MSRQKQKVALKRRGDKNVINGCKKSMISSIRYFYSKTNMLQIIQSILNENDMKFKTQTVTWIYICLLKFVSITQARKVLQKYKEKMEKKINKAIDNAHKQYNEKKKLKQNKFLMSAQYILQDYTIQGIAKSINILFKYQKCSNDAKQKIGHFIHNEKINLKEGKKSEKPNLIIEQMNTSPNKTNFNQQSIPVTYNNSFQHQSNENNSNNDWHFYIQGYACQENGVYKLSSDDYYLNDQYDSDDNI